MKNCITVIIICLFFSLNAFCQNVNESISAVNKKGISSSLGGIGLGLDYGGLGIQVTKIFKPVAFFFGFGYNQAKLSPVGGIRLMPGQTGIFIPYVKMMYGYNGVFINENKTSYISYGFTPGIGFHVVISKESSAGISVDLNFPIRQKSFMNAYNEFSKSSNSQTDTFSPVLGSMGFFINFGQD